MTPNFIIDYNSLARRSGMYMLSRINGAALNTIRIYSKRLNIKSDRDLGMLQLHYTMLAGAAYYAPTRWQNFWGRQPQPTLAQLQDTGRIIINLTAYGLGYAHAQEMMRQHVKESRHSDMEWLRTYDPPCGKSRLQAIVQGSRKLTNQADDEEREQTVQHELKRMDMLEALQKDLFETFEDRWHTLLDEKRLRHTMGDLVDEKQLRKKMARMLKALHRPPQIRPPLADRLKSAMRIIRNPKRWSRHGWRRVARASKTGQELYETRNPLDKRHPHPQPRMLPGPKN